MVVVTVAVESAVEVTVDVTVEVVGVEGELQVLVEVNVVSIVEVASTVTVVNSVEEVNLVVVTVGVAIVAEWVKVMVKVRVEFPVSEGDAMTNTTAAPMRTIIAVRRTVNTATIARLSGQMGLVLWGIAVTENMTLVTPST